VPKQPNVFYIGVNNGGVWRTNDYGRIWTPIFDDQPSGSIGALAVAQSDPNVIYAGSGEGLQRPDLSTGDGMYKSTDAGKTWTHLGLRDAQQIPQIVVDPSDPNRLFVAVLGHAYGPNEERGIFRSTDGGKTFTKVLFKDDYTSGNDVRIDPADPNTVYAALWQQQQAFWEGGDFGGGSGGIFKSSDGGTTWAQLTDGLPPVLEANLAIAPSNPKTVYAMVASVNPAGGSGPVGFYKSADGGLHWTLRTHGSNAAPDAAGTADPRPLIRIGGGDVPTIVVDSKDENVVYSASTVMWRTEDGGSSWSAVRGAPGGDDYQRIWVSPQDANLILAVSDQGAVVSANLFSMLGVSPALGRGFILDEDQPGREQLPVVLSYEFWQSHFGGDPNVLGRALTLDNGKYSVAGVMPPHFQFPVQSQRIELWTTIARDLQGKLPMASQRGVSYLRVIARLKPGIEIPQAQSDLKLVQEYLNAQYPENRPRGVTVQSESDEIAGAMRSVLMILLGTVGFVLLIACANVASLLLARATVRQREFTLRSALGASRSMIVRQLLTESVLLAMVGGIVGLLFAHWAASALVSMAPQSLARTSEVARDFGVLGMPLVLAKRVLDKRARRPLAT